MRRNHPVVAWPSPDGLPPQAETGAAASSGAGQPILMVLGAVLLFSVSDAFAKKLGAHLPGFQIAWARYIVFFAFSLWLAGRRGLSLPVSGSPRLQLLRALCLLLSATLFLLGLGRLPVAEATAISFATPAFITILSIPLLGEVVKRRRWTAVLIGLAGVLVVVRPGGEAFTLAALFPLGSALCGALAVILTRGIGDRDPLSTTLLWSSGIGLAALSISSPAWFVAMGGRDLYFAAMMGALYAVAQWLLVAAYRRCDASFLAPFSYAQILFATLVGLIVFRSWPDAVSLAGIMLVALSGVYTLHREGILGRLRARRREWLRLARRGSGARALPPAPQ